MRLELLSLCILASVAGVQCLLPEVTVDEDLPIGPMDPSGSPGGEGDDGDRERACANYCEIFTRVCTGHPADSYSDVRDCQVTCLVEGEWPLGESPDTPNSVLCREFHSVLAETAPAMHCFHAAEFPSMGFCEAVVGNSP